MGTKRVVISMAEGLFLFLVLIALRYISRMCFLWVYLLDV